MINICVYHNGKVVTIVNDHFYNTCCCCSVTIARKRTDLFLSPCIEIVQLFNVPFLK